MTVTRPCQRLSDAPCAEIQQLVAEFVNSGMRRSEFCRSSGLELWHAEPASEEVTLEKVVLSHEELSFLLGGIELATTMR